MIAQISIVFFFSSRRRHTRLQGDWSSDVCYSDLSAKHSEELSDRNHLRGGGVQRRPRKEERRGGEESRSPGGADDLKKKKETMRGGLSLLQKAKMAESKRKTSYAEEDNLRD